MLFHVKQLLKSHQRLPSHQQDLTAGFSLVFTYHQGRQDNCKFSSKIVACEANGDLAKDFPHQQSIRNLGADSGSVLFGIFLFEKDVGHGHKIVEVSIRD